MSGEAVSLIGLVMFMGIFLGIITYGLIKSKGTESKLLEAEQLLKKGKITEAEYQELRASILKSKPE